MRIKQKELIGKIPQVTYTKTLPNRLVVIAQVFDNPKCVNIIKKVNNKVTERQCYTLTDDMYQKYIDNYIYNCFKGNSNITKFPSKIKWKKHHKSLANYSVMMIKANDSNVQFL